MEITEEGVWVYFNHSHHSHGLNLSSYEYYGEYNYEYLPWDYGDYFNYSGDSDFIFDDTSYDRLARSITMYYVPCLLAVGFAGNLAILAILLASPLRLTSRAIYLVATAVTDLLLLLLTLLRTRPLIGIDLINTSDASCKAAVYFLHVSDSGHIFTMLAVVDSVIAVIWPVRWKRISGWRPALLVTTLVTAILLMYSGHAVPQVSVSHGFMGEQFCHYADYILGMTWYIVDLSIFNILPCVIMVGCVTVMMIVIYRRRRDPVTHQAGPRGGRFHTQVLFVPATNSTLLTTTAGDTSMESCESGDVNNDRRDSSRPTTIIAPHTRRDWFALPLSLTVFITMLTIPYAGMHLYTIHATLHGGKHPNHNASLVIFHIFGLVNAIKVFFYLIFWGHFRQELLALNTSFWYRIGDRWYRIRDGWHRIRDRQYHPIVA